jgi:hypothetical protein
MRSLFCLLTLGLLSGCSSYEFFSNPSGVTTPTPVQLSEFATETANKDALNTGEYLIASVNYTNEKCHEFFNLLDRFKQDSSLLDQVITAGVAAGSPLIALKSAHAATVSILSSTLLFANQVNKSAADIYAFSSYKDQLKTHVFESMIAYQKSKGLDLIQSARYGVSVVDVALKDSCATQTVSLSDGNKIKVNLCKTQNFLQSKAPADLMIARGMAADYAALCSLSNMKKIITAALEKTQTGVTASSAGSPTTSATQPTTAAVRDVQDTANNNVVTSTSKPKR